MNLPRFAVNRKSLVLAALALAVFWSLASAFGMQRREDPGTTQRQTLIVTTYPGATTENVEQLVTKKIVDDVRGVEHVDHVQGTSRPGISQIDVYFDDAISDANPVLRDVRNHLDDLRAELPAGIGGPTIIDDVWKTYPIIVGISAPELSNRELRDLAKTLSDQLAALPDAGLVKMVGEQTQQVSVDLDLQALAEYGIAPESVTAGIAARNELVPSGTIALGSRIAQLSPGNGLHDAADVALAPVATIGDRIVRVGDVARVHSGYPDPPDEIVESNGQRAIALAIMTKETSSVTTLGPEVERALESAKATWPAGVSYQLLANQPHTVSARVSDFFLNLIEGVFLVTVLVALLMGLRNGILVGLTVVLSIVLTFGVMPLLHVDINQISILALIIALGVIVDAGIVAIDNIERRLREGLPRREAAWRGVSDLWFPLLTSTLVAMTSFLPFRLMGGAVGDFVRDLAVVTTIALAMSLLVAYFISPIVGEWFAVPATVGSGQTGPLDRIRALFDRLLDRAQRAYEPLATAALRRPAVTVALAGALFVSAVIALPHLGVQFFPSADRDQFFIEITAPDGTDIRSTHAIAQNVDAILAKQSGITSWGTFVGAGAPRFYYNVLSEQPRPSYAQIIVNTVDVPTANRLVAELQPVLAAIPDARIQAKKLEQGPPVGAPIQFRISSESASDLPPVAERLRRILHDTPGAVSVRDSLGVPTTKLDLQIDAARAVASGVSDASVQQLVALAYGGVTATEIREADRQTPVVVRLGARARHDPSALEGLAVPGADGRNVPLGEVAQPELASQTSVATYRDGLPTVIVSADVNGRLASDVLADFKSRLSGVTLPAGVRLTYAGEDEQTAKSFRNLLIAAVIGLMLNQIILLWEFRALRLSLVILTAVPLGLIGAVVGLALTGNHFGFVAFLGLASLGGIVTNHTIVLFEYAKREVEHDPSISMERALVVAGTKRLRPILLTVVTSIAGLLPLALSTQSLWKPFCWVVIFGLAGSMAMTLVAIPAIYRLTSSGYARSPRGVGASRDASRRPWPRLRRRSAPSQSS
jgi:multidrug efflux pump subunit AcrB